MRKRICLECHERAQTNSDMCPLHHRLRIARNANRPPLPACNVDGCTRRASARGMCATHYQYDRWEQHKKPKETPAEPVAVPTPEPVVETPQETVDVAQRLVMRTIARAVNSYDADGPLMEARLRDDGTVFFIIMWSDGSTTQARQYSLRLAHEGTTAL